VTTAPECVLCCKTARNSARVQSSALSVGHDTGGAVEGPSTPQPASSLPLESNKAERDSFILCARARVCPGEKHVKRPIAAMLQRLSHVLVWRRDETIGWLLLGPAQRLDPHAT